MDPKKAFDTTDHEIVLSKLELYGFKGTTLNLSRNYLSDRTQVTVLDNIHSEINYIRRGVPQALGLNTWTQGSRVNVKRKGEIGSYMGPGNDKLSPGYPRGKVSFPLRMSSEGKKGG